MAYGGKNRYSTELLLVLTLSGSGNPEYLSAEPANDQCCFYLLQIPPVCSLGDFWWLGRCGSEDEEGSFSILDMQLQR